MKRAIIFTLLLSLPFILTQCDQTHDGDQQNMMGDRQTDQMMENREQPQANVAQMMRNPEQRQAMMTQMMQNPEMHREYMSQMNSSMMNENHEMMLDRMELMMNDPEQREQMKSHMQEMIAMMESGEFNREQMRELMEQSPMMGMHMNNMHMMEDSE